MLTHDTSSMTHDTSFCRLIDLAAIADSGYDCGCGGGGGDDDGAEIFGPENYIFADPPVADVMMSL